jgi:thymidylate synthase ThyX
MSQSVAIIADSVGPSGVRITTFQLKFPRFLLAQLNTHRAFSRSARSSRAVPTAKLIEEVLTDPVVPDLWGKNRPGMKSIENVSLAESVMAKDDWLEGRDRAADTAKRLAFYGIHKQLINRVLEPYLYANVVLTATDFDNFFHLRCHHDAQPEMQSLALAMARAYRDGKPAPLPRDGWHLPYVTEAEQDDLRSPELSMARCARVSYRPFDGGEPDREADLDLAAKLAASAHWSPAEHQGIAMMSSSYRSANFRGWHQYRVGLMPEPVPFDFDSLDKV